MYCGKCGAENPDTNRFCIGCGIDLSQVPPGEYDMTCLPLRVAGGDGAPARVILRSRG